MIRFRTIALLCGCILLAVSTSGCGGGFQYLSHKDLAGQARMQGQSYITPKGHYGVIRLKGDETRSDSGRDFVLRREKSKYMAETTLHETNKFRRSNIAFVVDHKRQHAGFEFKLKY